MLKMLCIDAVAPEPIISDIYAARAESAYVPFSVNGASLASKSTGLSIECFTPMPLPID